ncbi:hypothetical protein, partial [Bradyrhizobium japonicum]
MPEACTIALQGHGSKRNPASRQATEQVARTIEQSAAVAKVAAAFLEEPPFLEETAAAIVGPTVVLRPVLRRKPARRQGCAHARR